MDFFIIQNNKFYIYKKCITIVKQICNIIKFLCMRNYNIHKIQSFLNNNYYRNGATNNDDITNVFFTYDGHYDIISFQAAFDEYQYNYVIYLIKRLLSLYQNHQNVIIYALLQLITLMIRNASHTIFKLTMPFNDNNNTYVCNIFDKMIEEKRFIDSKLSSIIYRELYLSYLTIKASRVLLERLTFVNVVVPRNNEYIFNLLKVSYFANDFIADIRDLVSLSLCSKHLNQYFSTNYIDNVVISNFKDTVESVYKLNFDQLNIELLKVNGIISGSTMLQCFYGNSKLYNENSDLDIYIWENEDENYQSLVSYLTSNDYTLQVINSLVNENPDLVHLSFSYQLVDHFRQVQSFKHSKTNRTVQLTTVVRSEISSVKLGKYVTSKFDISFLKNYWNGKNFTTLCRRDIMSKKGTINENVLSICSYDNFFSRIDDCNTIRYFDSKTTVQVRVLKYTERGFTISNPLRKSLFY